MMSSEQLFLKAVNAYKTWLDSGKDFLNHSDLFEQWDDAVCDYADSIYVKRAQAVSHVVMSLKVFK
jgi:recombinational DNA repair ATPase RecF